MIQFVFTRLFAKQLKKVPTFIQIRLKEWQDLVMLFGLSVVRSQFKGYHDEPLQGQRVGQRSVRLNKQWRVIYEETTGTLIELQEITPHDYRTR